MYLAACVIALGLAGCSSRVDEAPHSPPTPGLTGDEVARARALFDDGGCAVCHGDAGEELDSGPPLTGLAEYWDVERLAAYVRDPSEFRQAPRDLDAGVEYEAEMPAYDYLSEEELQLLARWLLTL